MQQQEGGDVTVLLEGRSRLLERELQKLARHYMAAEPSGQILQTTALTNEAYFWRSPRTP
jgi:hypothetical protein